MVRSANAQREMTLRRFRRKPSERIYLSRNAPDILSRNGRDKIVEHRSFTCGKDQICRHARDQAVSDFIRDIRCDNLSQKVRLPGCVRRLIDRGRHSRPVPRKSAKYLL